MGFEMDISGKLEMSTAEIKVESVTSTSVEFIDSLSQAYTVKKNVINKNVLSIKNNKLSC